MSIHAGLRATVAFLASDGKSHEELRHNRSIQSLMPCVCEVEGRAPSMVASQRVVDRWNYIINDLCVAVKMGSHGPGCRLSVPEPSCERLMCRPAVGQYQSSTHVGYLACC